MRMIAAIAPLCATMPIFGRALCGGRSTLNSKVSAAPTSEAAHADAVRSEHRDVRSARRGGQLLLLGAAGIAHLRIARRRTRSQRRRRAARGRDRVDHGRLRNDQHGDIDAMRQVVDARHAGPAVELGRERLTRWIAPSKRAALQIGEHRAAHVAGLRRHADDRDRARPQQAVEAGSDLGVH